MGTANTDARHEGVIHGDRMTPSPGRCRQGVFHQREAGIGLAERGLGQRGQLRRVPHYRSDLVTRRDGLPEGLPTPLPPCRAVPARSDHYGPAIAVRFFIWDPGVFTLTCLPLS